MKKMNAPMTIEPCPLRKVLLDSFEPRDPWLSHEWCVITMTRPPSDYFDQIRDRVHDLIRYAAVKQVMRGAYVVPTAVLPELATHRRFLRLVERVPTRRELLEALANRQGSLSMRTAWSVLRLDPVEVCRLTPLIAHRGVAFAIDDVLAVLDDRWPILSPTEWAERQKVK